MFPRAAFRPLLAAAVLALTVGSARAATADMLSPEGDSDTASALSGARADLADAEAYLAELEAGHFEGIFAVDGDALRCGEPSAQAGCQPLTGEDKAEAIAEAREMVANATAAMNAAQSAFAAAGGVEAAVFLE